MRPPFAAAVLIAVLVGGCAGTSARPASPSADSAMHPVAISLTSENILQWPLEAQKGFSRLHDELNALPGMADISPAYRISEHDFTTKDGYLIKSINMRKNMRHISIGFDIQPCLTIKAAGMRPNLIRSESGEDMHGNFVGYTYSVSGHGMTIDYTTAPSAPDCVNSVNIFENREK